MLLLGLTPKSCSLTNESIITALTLTWPLRSACLKRHLPLIWRLLSSNKRPDGDPLLCLTHCTCVTTTFDLHYFTGRSQLSHKSEKCHFRPPCVSRLKCHVLLCGYIDTVCVMFMLNSFSCIINVLLCAFVFWHCPCLFRLSVCFVLHVCLHVARP